MFFGAKRASHHTGGTPVMLFHKPIVKGEDCEWVVLVHGAGGSSSIWFKQLRALKQRYNVLLLDLRGHGRSKNLFKDHNYSFQDVSRDVIEVLDHLKLPPAHFIGISLGTIVIRTISELAPEKVKSMILGGAIVRMNFRSRFLMWLADVGKNVMPFIWLYRFFAFILMPRRRHRESRNLFVREATRLANKEFLRWFKLAAEVNPLLRYFREKELSIPTLYIMGEEDHMFLHQVQRLVQKHRYSLLTVFEKCGHVVNVERPERFNDRTIRFIDDLSEGRLSFA